MGEIGSTFIASGLDYCWWVWDPVYPWATAELCLVCMICTNPCWHKTHSDSYVATAPDINVLVKVSWTRAPGQVPGYHDIIVQSRPVRNHARAWDWGVQYAVSGTVMLGGNLGNWIKTEHDLYIWEFYVIITGSYKCTMSAICMQSTTGSTVTQFICSQNCEIDANIALGWLCMSGIPGLLCYQCWFLSLLLSALSSSVAATNH